MVPAHLRRRPEYDPLPPDRSWGSVRRGGARHRDADGERWGLVHCAPYDERQGPGVAVTATLHRLRERGLGARATTHGWRMGWWPPTWGSASPRPTPRRPGQGSGARDSEDWRRTPDCGAERSDRAPGAPDEHTRRVGIPTHGGVFRGCCSFSAGPVVQLAAATGPQRRFLHGVGLRLSLLSSLQCPRLPSSPAPTGSAWGSKCHTPSASPTPHLAVMRCAGACHRPDALTRAAPGAPTPRPGLPHVPQQDDPGRRVSSGGVPGLASASVRALAPPRTCCRRPTRTTRRVTPGGKESVPRQVK